MTLLWYDWVPIGLEVLGIPVHLLVLLLVTFSNSNRDFQGAFFTLYKSNGLQKTFVAIQAHCSSSLTTSNAFNGCLYSTDGPHRHAIRVHLGEHRVLCGLGPLQHCHIYRYTLLRNYSVLLLVGIALIAVNRFTAMHFYNSYKKVNLHFALNIP